MLIGLSEQEAATTLDLLVRHLLVNGPPYNQKEAQCLAGLFRFWRHPIPDMGVLLQPATE